MIAVATCGRGWFPAHVSLPCPSIVPARDAQVRDFKNVVRYEAFVLVDDEPLL